MLRNEKGQLLENVWQFSKIYASVSAQKIPLSSRYYPSTIIWEHPAEKHLDDNGEPNDAYWDWRAKGMDNPYPVRYPNGFQGRKECVCCIYFDEDEKMQRLNYIESRKKIYLC